MPRISKGKGKADTDSTGILFQVRKNVVYFDETAVGKAAQEALENAVKGLTDEKK